jgi:hypothetical protein
VKRIGRPVARRLLLTIVIVLVALTLAGFVLARVGGGHGVHVLF